MTEAKVKYQVKNYAVVVLAAGSSSRLGSPKQLLSYRGGTLLEHSIDSAKQINAEQVIVVLGSNKGLIEHTIPDPGVFIVENPHWESGIASSIKCGVAAAAAISPRVDALILMVCDQPYVNPEILNKLLIAQAESGNALIGCTYEATKGTPALFHRSLFPELLILEGDNGAKKLFEKYRHIASFVSFKGGSIDIDTSEDYKNLPK